MSNLSLKISVLGVCPIAIKTPSTDKLLSVPSLLSMFIAETAPSPRTSLSVELSINEILPSDTFYALDLVKSFPL